MPRFQRRYFIIFVILLLIEVVIALFAHDNFIRPFFGDFLVVILIYCFIKSFFNTPLVITAIGVLLFSYLIEVLQYFNIVKMLGLQNTNLARVVIGTSFEWTDLIAYTLGIGLVILLDKNKQPAST
ncbi:ribosomal maturation YjgA family protein [Parafilimonas terrae]|uniref:DUF2809 domain-containing protein n=1 Tax=Parafilimonas terrae TaxID=1465490 RepID=A0A1I5TDV9_9BACT|nr:DUF2809 domain-containing protein [Parafilimonas terrae]SFP81214.1 Protein of unknown function [Parafilimonas terrae]